MLRACSNSAATFRIRQKSCRSACLLTRPVPRLWQWHCAVNSAAAAVAEGQPHSGAVSSEQRRAAAAVRKAEVPGVWKGRLGVLTQELWRERHPAAAEVAALLGYADEVDGVPGFFEPALLEALARLHVCQREEGISGHTAEVGVYHGRGFIPLALLCGPQEGAVGVDLFEAPQRPEDNSGVGSLPASGHNIRRSLSTGEETNSLPQRVVLIKQDSARVAHVDLRVAVSKALPQSSDEGFRLFSIDGCHSARATTRDLRLAAASLADGGVVILDDVFNPDWPEVCVGLALYLEGYLYEKLQIGGSEDALMPFYIGFNKVMLCQPEYHDTYFQLMADAPGCRKVSRFFDARVAVHGAGWLAAFAGNDSHTADRAAGVDGSA